MKSNPSSTSIWEVLSRQSREVVTTVDLERLAARLGRSRIDSVRHLRRAGYLVPLFKGHYYVRTPAEIRLEMPRFNPLELFALAARSKGIGAWYYGLQSALRLNGMTHEDRREESVVSTSLYRIRGVRIGERRFVIRRWDTALFGFGLVARRGYRFSDPEKTVVDLAYLDYWRDRKGRPPTREWEEYVSTVRATTVRRYLRHYPAPVARAVEEHL